METFVLTKSVTYRRYVKIFVKDIHGKFESKMVTFTTEHLVPKESRHKAAAKRASAEFSTNNELIIDALLSDTGYGKDFTLKGDPKGEKRRAYRSISSVDHKLMALKNLFASYQLAFDENKPVEVLQEELNAHVLTQAGKPMVASAPSEIKIEKVDVQKEIQDRYNSIKSAYQSKHGKPLPDMSKMDSMAVLGALELNPDFDVEGHLDKGQDESIPPPKGETLEDEKARLHKEYFNVIGTNVANAKSNDLDWIKKKIETAKKETVS